MSSALHASMLSLALGLAAGCNSHPATQVLVYFHADAELRAEAASVHVVVTAPDGSAVLDETNAVGTGSSSLARVPLVPADGDATRVFTIEADLLDSSGGMLAHVLARSGYTKDELRELHLWFDAACRAPIDCGAGQTCDRGVCVGACFDAVPSGDTARSTPRCSECEECIGNACAPIADGTACGCSETDSCNAGVCVAGAAVVYATAGHLHSCAATRNTRLFCWGSNRVGQLGSVGDSSTTPRAVALDALGEGSAATDHTCWLQFTGDRYCWGYDGNGQLGIGTMVEDIFAEPVPGGGAEPGYSVIDTGWYFSCAISVDGQILCWGTNEHGECARDPTVSLVVVEPMPVDAEGGWTSLTAGGFHACGIKRDGRLFCWGMNGSGELGIGDNADRAMPVQSGCHDGTCFDDWVSVAAGDFHTCAIREGGELWCWGGGLNGQLGVGSTMEIDSNVLLRVDGPPSRWRVIGGGSSHTCGIAEDETLWCWGRNDHGQLGTGDLERRASPTRVQVPGGDGWIKLAIGREHSCAVRSDETLWCWGWNEDGQLGRGFTTPVGDPSPTLAARVCFPPGS